MSKPMTTARMERRRRLAQAWVPLSTPISAVEAGVLMLAGLKMGAVIDWSWWWVLAPGIAQSAWVWAVFTAGEGGGMDS